jgi:cytochrome d ubiquinol oxidase subunit I
MVCLGAHFSAVWIVVANSFMQTPAGFHIVGEGLSARAEITDFWALVFNPSSMDRLSHVICGAWQAGAFLVVSISAFYLLRGRHFVFARASLKIALAVGFLASVLQWVTGHDSAVGVAEHQPAKLAAFEGHYATRSEAPLYLWGWVDEQEERVRFGVSIPGLLSYLVHGRADEPVIGLHDIPLEDRPPVNSVFQLYHLMVAIGGFMVVLAALAVFYWIRGTLVKQRWLLWLLVFSVLGPQLANQAGWFAAEIGRQPWIVYGYMRTSEGLSNVVQAQTVLGSLALFTFIYLLLFAVFVYLLNDKIRHGPDAADLVPTGKLGLTGEGQKPGG